MATTLLVDEDVSAYNLGSECFSRGRRKRKQQRLPFSFVVSYSLLLRPVAIWQQLPARNCTGNSLCSRMFALHPFRSKKTLHTEYDFIRPNVFILYNQLFENDNKRKTKDIITLDVIEELSKNISITNKSHKMSCESYCRILFSRREILSETLTVI